MSEKLLVEEWKPILDADKNPEINVAGKIKPIRHDMREPLARLLENQQNYLMEDGSTSLNDFTQYTPILVPAVRRIFPNLVSNDLVGVQPMNSPNGFVFAIRNGYETGVKGAAKNNLQNYNTADYPGNLSTNKLNPRTQLPDQSFQSIGVVVSGQIPAAAVAITDATNTYNFTIDADGAASGAAADWGNVVLAQYDAGQNVTKMLIQLKAGKDSIAAKTALATGAVVSFGGAGVELGTDTNIRGLFNNEAGYNLLFGTAYAPYQTTASAEYMQRSAMKSMKVSVEKFSVTAETRKYKAEYSMELAQDLKAQFGLNAEAELINILEYEISAELDRDIVDTIHGVATNAGSWFYGTPGQIMGKPSDLTGQTAQTADGRWELEKFRSLYTRIVNEANRVALSTRRGPANFILASLNVVTALETLSNFMYSQVPGNVEPQFGVAKVGTLDGRFSVYLDTFSWSDYFIVGYKGSANTDSGIMYCPYIPLQMIKVTDPNTFANVIGFQSRDAIMGSIWGAEKYYRKVLCDFTGSSFINDTYFF